MSVLTNLSQMPSAEAENPTTIDKIQNLLDPKSPYTLETTLIEKEGKQIRAYGLTLAKTANIKGLIELAQTFNTHFSMNQTSLNCLVYEEAPFSSANLAQLAMGVKDNADVHTFFSNLNARNMIVCFPQQKKVGFINFFQKIAVSIHLMDELVNLRSIDPKIKLNDLYEVLSKE